VKYFTSDNHFGHEKIIRYENRPFSSVEQMNREMVRRWNKKVQEDDEVYIIGDFAFTNPVPILKQLNGRKYLVTGNHDRHLTRSKDALAQLGWAKDYYKLRVGDLRIVMFHFPIMVWDMQDYGSIHLHGHVHSCPESRHPHFQQIKNSYNVGVDVNNYEPVSLETILKRLEIAQNVCVSA
jgi:calcineurin-like phosphoesterase family protein